MAAKASVDATEWLCKQVEETPDGLEVKLTEMVNILMSAEVESIREAGYGGAVRRAGELEARLLGRPWSAQRRGSSSQPGK